MQQFRAEHLQPSAKFFDQLVDFFFESRVFTQLIADMDIHAKPQNHG